MEVARLGLVLGMVLLQVGRVPLEQMGVLMELFEFLEVAAAKIIQVYVVEHNAHKLFPYIINTQYFFFLLLFLYFFHF